ncbi:hypothetical protein FC70_GL001577 [Paucilactobacillus oligofermentans DSM 15707 = LMG 22743]|uniref:Uncharacterized protein n=1 Tax=Paucilactobacillus oligofermentans DSM 15707 = LMG 22743 TaxID=1423778 RepID=A0A0R1RD47_9LACO|nr:MurR/RpiR family transcriptional regulator [Paucilactobacillus oligofermentans]KRL54775.1 hypothetical protein FC70_GL001577 [Paucilactobacillus oligofermentans DSM 15707 = LMG 22743]CUS26310.1 N-acetylneuraminate catabolism transcriptional regulator NanR [Paucilactobacillus oligofermentans DSM 15707 = LMG 22743]
MEIVEHIKNQYSFLSTQEQKVALSAIQKGAAIRTMGIEELASQLDVSKSTISRFVKKIGCKNFVDFRLQFVNTEDPVVVTGVQGQFDEEKQTSVEIYHLYQHVITQTQEKMNQVDIEKLVKWIAESRRVFIYGLGSSGYTTEEFGQRLIRMGIQTVTATESHMMLITSNIMNRDDLVIGISNSGKTIEVNRALMNAKKSGAKTASITSDMIGPINQASQITIHVEDSTKLAEGRFINSQFAITYAIDILSRLLLENQQYNWSMKKTIDSIIDDKQNSNNLK